ncbi:MAG: DPP IV N-terminal domain-containing protein, partial [Acidimicrobiales bacterium]
MVDTFPRQNARTRRFTSGVPRSFRLAADGSRVLFLRSSSGSDSVNSLWCLDIGTGAEHLVVDPRELIDDSEANLTQAEKTRRERARESGGGIVSFDTDDDANAACFVLGGRLFRADVASGETIELPTPGDAFDPRFDPSGTKIGYVSGSTLRVTGESGDGLLIEEAGEFVSWGSAEFVAAEEMGRGRGFWWDGTGDAVLVARVDVAKVSQWHIAGPVDPADQPRSIRYPHAGSANAVVDLAIVSLDGSRVDVDWRSGGYEYLARASWGRRSEPTITVQTRDQRTLAVLAVDPHTGETRLIHSQTDDAWVDLMTGVPAWCGEKLLTTACRDETTSLALDGEIFTPAGLQIRRVLRAAKDHVVVAATSDATEVHIHRIGIDGTTTPLTTEPGVHGGVFTKSLSVFVTSNTQRSGSTATAVRDEASIVIASLAEQSIITPNAAFNIIGQRRINAAVLLPKGDHAPGSLPVLLDPYGGPHALRVQKSRAAMYASQWFADQGFAVIVADGRGTPGRGPAWEREVLHDLANPVLDDQVDTLHGLADLYPQMDMSRVAIRGWSFGGYLAALAVLKRPDVFSAAIAGAPVTEWRLYDTHYTERYLGNPA